MPFGAAPSVAIPDLPLDITVLSDSRLMSLFAEMTAWTNYCATNLARAEVEETRADADLRYEEAVAFSRARPDAKVTTVRAHAALIEPVGKARQRVTEAYAARKLAAVMYNNCDRIVNLLSRELTRRVGREPVERRNQRWNP